MTARTDKLIREIATLEGKLTLLHTELEEVERQIEKFFQRGLEPDVQLLRRLTKIKRDITRFNVKLIIANWKYATFKNYLDF